MKRSRRGDAARRRDFVAALGIGVATYITIADSGGGSPVCLGGGHGCETVANSSYSHLPASTSPSSGSSATCCCFAAALCAGTGARIGGFAVSLGGFGFSVYLTYLELFEIEAICQWCVASAVLMTILFAVNAIRMLGYVGTPA